MGPADMADTPPLDMEQSAPPASGAKGSAARLAAVEYHDSSEQCMNCQHFDAPTRCTNPQVKATVDPEGHCALFAEAESAGEDAQEGPDAEVGEAAPPAEEDQGY